MSINHLTLTARPLWTGAMACYPYSDALKRKFTVVSRFGDEYALYRVMGDKILVPRAVCPLGAEDHRVTGVPQRFDACTFKPRNDDQLRAVMACRGLLSEGKNFILRAPTGSGKTALSMPLIAAVGRTTLVVVPKEDLMDRWYEDLQKILGLKRNEIGVVRQDNFDVSGRKVVIGMLQSLAKVNRYPAWIKQELGFVIFDEVHRLAADHFMTVAGNYPAKLRLGLSATPERRDGREDAFMSHIGPVMVSIEAQHQVPTILRVRTGWRCPRLKSGDKVQHMPGRDAHVRRVLFKDNARNAMVVRACRSAYDKGRFIVVFSDYIDHLERLYEAIRSSGIPARDLGMYIGTGVSKRDLDLALGKRVILATYGKMSEGTSIPWLDTCILAGPRADVIQPVGRIRREYENKQQPVVIDLVDDDSFVYKNYAESRARWYRSIDAEIKDCTI